MAKNYIANIPKNSFGYVVSNIIKTNSNKTNIILAKDEEEQILLTDQLKSLRPGEEVYPFYAWDTLPYDRVSPHFEILAERIFILDKLLNFSENTQTLNIVTTYNALQQKLIPKIILEIWPIKLVRGFKLGRDHLTEKLITLGYNRSETANEVGDFAVRGGIIDFVTAGNVGIRVDFFGDNIDEIKQFDPSTQLTLSKLDSFTLLPVNEILFDNEALESFKTNYTKQFTITQNDYLYHNLVESQKFPGFENWLPFFYEELSTFFDYLPTDPIFYYYKDDIGLIETFSKKVSDTYQLRLNTSSKENVYNPVNPQQLYLTSKEIEDILEAYQVNVFSQFDLANNVSNQKIAALLFNKSKNPYEQLKEYQIADGVKKRKKIIVACNSTGSLERLRIILTNHEFFIVEIDNIHDLSKVSGKTLGITIFPITNGFETENLIIVSEQDLLGEKLKRKATSKAKIENFLLEANSLSEGELIVHKNHGIGKFIGLETINVNNHPHDCVKLIYAGEDKLYIPVENIDLLSKYGSDESAALDKLGTAAWQARTAKLKQRIKLQAEAIIKLAAERSLKEAPSLMPPLSLYEEFCTKFPYAETDDQLTAIDDILQDFTSGKPMDRLICGDVGFGKTEVAMRAAFAALFGLVEQNGEKSQIAIIAPTTLLARQHYNNCLKRFEGLPVRIKQLSRLVSAKEATKVRTELSEGSIDIIIGTHALLAENIKFKNLNLVIIDEEQHFGVAQKEKLKKFKANIHVLTLSATPIPRTMHMAISGMRDLSLIATPPVDRLATKTFVMPYDPIIMREAVLNEKHRGGRIFYVAPRVSDLKQIEDNLKEQVPEIKYKVAHGQMSPVDLDKIMNGFYDGEFDLLLSTTIVESGLDVPAANTIIIHRADMLGLAQLYQLRGRVGRGKIRAFCYFTTPPIHILTSAAKKRLEVLSKLDSIGAGFSLASHDMDIRGVGNLLGDEQSGQIKEVGVELYQEMLKEAIEELRFKQDHTTEATDKIYEKYSPQINLGLPVLIPEKYVSDLNLRLGLYRRIAAITTREELDSFYAEMIDRFGPIPENTKHLFTIIELKQLCLQANIEKIDSGPKGIVITFHKNQPKNLDKLLNYIKIDPINTKLRPDHKFVIMREFKDDLHKVEVMKKMLGNII
ncbi:transcription-repair coupling factor [Rickettsiales endosymbiont of Stachyamoeba lipophora]|uniref:transcription-repair coupling factor n=1 Tax=Rickettsiales endosymbiont of Stachyamoeba lipophora TaxID=2486578 RepID=UPI000F64D0ED|nr:transcription-repair coupling factor [Rickettsiales endosymbiont of Stachyamoeba lipophora]AZL15019.1 transcription-repair coupling factor [Rickettsiales endosymbiont of Stachyamoeba lipophora]